MADRQTDGLTGEGEGSGVRGLGPGEERRSRVFIARACVFACACVFDVRRRRDGEGSSDVAVAVAVADASQHSTTERVSVRALSGCARGSIAILMDRFRNQLYIQADGCRPAALV